MQPTFERGDARRPRGHALVYFISSADPEQVVASYVVVPPIPMDLAKYIPPMFASQMSAMIPSGPSVFPLPPFPEQVESVAWLRRVAEARDDDVLDGGRVTSGDPQHLLMLISDLAGEYGRLCATYAEQLADDGPTETEPEALPGVDVDDLLLSVLSESEKVGRLAKLTGTVRYAVEGSDRALLAETIVDMERVGRQLREQYRVTELIQAAQDPDPSGGRLAELLLQRCFKLAAEEYAALEALDAEIAELQRHP